MLCSVMIRSVYESRSSTLDTSGRDPAEFIAASHVTGGGPAQWPSGSDGCARHPGAQLGLDHLARRVAGQLVDEDVLARHLVVGQLLQTEGAQLVTVRLHAGVQDDEGHQVLAEHGVRGADDGDLLDRVVLHQDVLDVGGVHVVAAADDHVLGASDDVEVAVGIELAKVTRDQPAVPPHLRRRIGVLEVLALATRHLEAHLAHGVGRQLLVVLVDDAYDRRRGDLAHRTGALDRLALGHDAVGRARFGHAVIVRHQGVGHLLLQPLQHVGRQGRAPHRAHLHRREVGVGEVRVVDEQVGHGRDEEHGHGAFLLHHAQPAVGVEARLVDHLHPELHGRVDESDAGEREERAGVHPAGTGPVGLDVADHGAVVVADRHALGPARRPRGVEDVGQVVGRPGHLEGRTVAGGGLGPAEHRDPGVRRWRPALRAGVDQGHEVTRPELTVAAQEVSVGHHGGRARMLEHVRHLGRGQARVHGDGHAAGPVGGGIRDEPVQRQLRAEVDADPAVGLQARLDQAAGHGVGRTVPFGEGHGAHVDDGEGGAIAEFLGHTRQMIVHQHGRHNNNPAPICWENTRITWGIGAEPAYEGAPIMTSSIIRAAVYVRISEDKDADRKGVVRQDQDCRAICAGRGWQVIEPPYLDNDITASKGKFREAYDRLLRDIAAKRVEAVVAQYQDRITRTPAELEDFALVASRAGIDNLTTVEGDIPLGPNADMLIARIKGAVAAEESRKIGVRVRRKKVELAEQGKPSGSGIRAFGYNWPHRIKGTTDRYVEPDPNAEPYSIYEPEAKAIRWAYDYLLNHDGTIQGIQREWTQRGLHTIRGSVRADGMPAWNRATIRRLLMSPRIAGLREHHKEVVGKATWDAIVPTDRWEAMCALLNDPTRANRPHSPVNRQYPLRGLLLCGTCGRKMTGTFRSKAQGSSRYYHCRRDAGGCLKGGAWIKADSIEAWVIGLAIGVAQSSDALDMIQAESGVLADELRALTAERAETQAKLDRLEDKWANDTIGATAYDRNRKAFQNALKAADDRITAIEASSALGQVEGSLMTDWTKLTADEQRKILRSLVADITVMSRTKNGGNAFDPKRVRIGWRSSALALAAGLENVPDDFDLPPEWQQFVAQGIAVANVAKLAVTL